MYRETIRHPTEFQYIELEKNYSDSLACQCKNISIEYSTFMDIQPEYHQLCSSDLISLEWIYYHRILPSVSYLPLEYQYYAGDQFHLLAMFCQQAKETIDNARSVFLRTQFVGSRIVSKQLFEFQMNSTIRDWKLSTTNGFVRTIELFRTVLFGNQLTNGYSNIEYSVDNVSRKTSIIPKVFSNCSCALNQSCILQMGIYESTALVSNYTVLYYLDNFYIGCSHLESLLLSTLECFYNQSLMIENDKHMYTSLGSSFNFSALDSNLSSPYETIESIINRLMVDSWFSNISFSSYYKSCNPLSCTFNYRRRNNIFYVVTEIIEIYGGLSFGMTLFIWIVLELIEKIIQGISRLDLLILIKHIFICRNENQIIRRLHTMLVLITLCILCSFVVFRSQSIHVNIDKPSFPTYQYLSSHFSDSLQCSCSQISIKYKTFLNIKPQFHQVCSSDFVTNSWIMHLYNQANLTYLFDEKDVWHSRTAQFQSLSLFCQLSIKMVNDSLSQIITKDFININLLSEYLLNEQIETIIKQFKITIPDLFENTFSLIRGMIGSNMIISGLSTNWIIDIPSMTYAWTSAHTIPIDYSECNCGLSSKCIQLSKDMLVGCYPIEVLLQSTFQCLYDQQCIDPSYHFLSMKYLFNSTRFQSNTTIELIVNQLMIEEYLNEIFYEEYFNQCSPLLCTYSYTDEINVIQGITLLISLEGGLVIIFKVFSTIIVKLFRCQTSTANQEID
jgi:hypothetical protein